MRQGCAPHPVTMKTYGRRRSRPSARREDPLLLTPASPRQSSHLTPPSSSTTSATITPSTAGAMSPTRQDGLPRKENASPSTPSTQTSLSFCTPAETVIERARRHSSLKAVPLCSLKSASSSPQHETVCQQRRQGKRLDSPEGKSGDLDGSRLTTSPLARRSNPWSKLVEPGIPEGVSKRRNGGRGVRQPTRLSSSTAGTRKRSRASAALPTGQNAKGEQTFLDFGQRGFGRRVLCQRCGMLYVCGAGEDEASHAVACARAARGVEFAGWKQERVKATFPDDGGRVVEIRRGDPTPHLAKLHEVERMMDAEMGFAAAGATDGGGASPPGSVRGRDQQARKSLKASHAFVYVRDRRVLGCVIAERIETARRVLPGGVKDDGGHESKAREHGSTSMAGGEKSDPGSLKYRTRGADEVVATDQPFTSCPGAGERVKVATATGPTLVGARSLTSSSGSAPPDSGTSGPNAFMPDQYRESRESPAAYSSAAARESIEDEDIVGNRGDEDTNVLQVSLSTKGSVGVHGSRDASGEGNREPLFPCSGFGNSDVRAWSAGEKRAPSSFSTGVSQKCCPCDEPEKLSISSVAQREGNADRGPDARSVDSYVAPAQSAMLTAEREARPVRAETSTPSAKREWQLVPPENGRTTPPLPRGSSTSSPPPLSGERPRLGVRRSVIVESEIGRGIRPDETGSTPERSKSSTPLGRHEDLVRPSKGSSDEPEAKSTMRCDARHADADGASIPAETPGKAGDGGRPCSFSMDSASSSIVSSPCEDIFPPLPMSGLVCAAEETPAVVGVLKIWVHASSRRQGVATRLVDTVREKMVYGCPLRPNQIAFSQPTREGQAFSTRYTDGDLLVY